MLHDKQAAGRGQFSSDDQNQNQNQNRAYNPPPYLRVVSNPQALPQLNQDEGESQYYYRYAEAPEGAADSFAFVELDDEEAADFADFDRSARAGGVQPLNPTAAANYEPQSKPQPATRRIRNPQTQPQSATRRIRNPQSATRNPQQQNPQSAEGYEQVVAASASPIQKNPQSAEGRRRGPEYPQSQEEVGADGQQGISLEEALALIGQEEQEKEWGNQFKQKAAGLITGGWSLSGRALSWLFDEGANPPVAEIEYMSGLKKAMYRFGGGVIAAWSAFLTQAVTPDIFPFLDIASKSGENLFAHGLTFNVKAILASSVFTFIFFVTETMFFDKRKTRAKRLLIALAFLVDWVINTIGWAALFNHTSHLEWNALWPLLRGQAIQWGSLLCQVAAVFTAVLPELMWDKARRAARKLAPQKLSGDNNSSSSNRGVWVRDENGNLRWLSEKQLRAVAKMRDRRG